MEIVGNTTVAVSVVNIDLMDTQGSGYHLFKKHQKLINKGEDIFHQINCTSTKVKQSHVEVL